MRTDATLAALSADATVREPLWTGVQPVAGLWFEAAQRDGDAHAARVLAHWRPGTQALRFADGDLLRYPQPALADCTTLPGLALCRLDGDRTGTVLASAPLTDAERAALRGVDVVLVRGARMHGLRFADGAPLDPSTWLDLGDLTLHDTFDCSATVAAPPLPPPTRRDVREALGGRIPPPSEERARFLREVAAETAKRRGRAIGTGGGGGGIGASLVDRALRWLGAGAGAIAGAGLPQSQRTGNGMGGVAPRTAPRPPSAWRDALTRLAVATRASRLIGWRQGAYLRRMMRRFEEDDPIEALRHALPIDRTGASLGQAFGTPGRRDDLRLGGQTGASVDIGLDDGTTQHLRDLYRRTFERLDRAGRIDEAAFVLGELLNARQECLDYLERHGRHAQAAELALTWQMPGATAVRLLLLAGDEARALQVARRDGEFAQAVAALEKPHPALAKRLRLHWGEALADRGEWLAAVDAVWPVPEARHLAAGWLRIAEDAGETLSARALVRRAQLLPDTPTVHADRLRALARPGGDAIDIEVAADARSALADALLAVHARTPAVAAIASALLPAIACDRAAGRNALGKSKLNKLLDKCDDPLLRADLPAWSLPPIVEHPALWARTGPIVLTAPAPGLMPILDAAPLPDREYLLALGEAGVVQVDARGRVRHRHAVPADALVLADNGQVALAVARREGVSRISRLDLVRQSCTDLGSLRVDAHAPRFDGAAWSVVADNRILVIDTARSLHDVVWHVGDLPGRLVIAQYSATHEAYLMVTPDGFETWTYHLPGRRLGHRDRIEIDPALPLLLQPYGSTCQPRIAALTAQRLELAFRLRGAERRIGIDGADFAAMHGDGDGIGITCHAAQNGVAIGVSAPGFRRFLLCRPLDGAPVATIDWPLDGMPRLRERGDHVLLFDDRGRVLDVRLDHAATTAFSLC
jgi:hypothetical protein